MSLQRTLLIILALVLILLAVSAGQDLDASGSAPGLAERLGYPEDTRLLIVHADDVGVSHGVNLATFDALASGQVTSGSIMVPCEGLQEVADYAAAHPEADLGIHLTLTRERLAEPGWGPVASKTDVPSLARSERVRS